MSGRGGGRGINKGRGRGILADGQIGRGAVSSTGRGRGILTDGRRGRGVVSFGGTGRGNLVDVSTGRGAALTAGSGRGRGRGGGRCRVTSEFVQATSSNLPTVTCFSVAEYFQSLMSSELRQAKDQRSADADYGDNAIEYVQVKRTNVFCSVEARFTPQTGNDS